MSNETLLASGRVYLRHPRPSDREEFLEGSRASRKLHGRWVTTASDPAAFSEYLQQSKSANIEKLLVCRKEDGSIVGAYNVSQIVHGPLCSAYLSYYVFEPFAGQGYMREGIQLALRYAFGPLGLHRLEANIQPGNAASIALVKGAGFRLEGYSPRYLKIAGRWRDHERWAMLAEDRARQRAGSGRTT